MYISFYIHRMKVAATPRPIISRLYLCLYICNTSIYPCNIVGTDPTYWDMAIYDPGKPLGTSSFNERRLGVALALANEGLEYRG